MVHFQEIWKTKVVLYPMTDPIGTKRYTLHIYIYIYNYIYIYMCQGLNSHYFHIIGDKLIYPIVGVYIPIIRIPIKGGMTIPNIATFDHGTYIFTYIFYRYMNGD